MKDPAASEASFPGVPARLQLLGGIRLYLGRRVVTRFPAGKSLQLLAFLALKPGVAHGRAFLADLLWPNCAPETGRARLSVALTFLRGLFDTGDTCGELLAADRATLCLQPGRIFTDVRDFERALFDAELGAAQSGTAAGDLQRLFGDALRVYGGDLLPGLTDEWVEAERARLAARYDAALAGWSSLTRRPPPRPALKDNHIIGGIPSPPPMSVADETIQVPGKGSLPPRVTALIGRDDAVAALHRLMREKVRLITLTGPGGVGKTHLALEAASGVTCRPVAWVPLADVSDPNAIAAAVADVMRLPPGAVDTVTGAVTHALNVVPTLVLLDNAEHLRAGVAEFVAEMQRTAPGSHFWVTSREPLDVAGECVYPVSPLSLPPEDGDDPTQVRESSACTLFAYHARMVRPDFAVTARNAALIARLCRRLDGIPLALELAAARVQTASLGQILQSVENGTQKLSSSARRGLPDRHRSLHAVLDWSVRLLSPETAGFLSVLSVFSGGWTTEAAEAVSGDALGTDRLAELVAASLVVAEEQAGGILRYRLLETVRGFAASRLDENGRREARDRHREYFTELAGRLFEGWWGCDNISCSLQALPEEDNLLAALNASRETNAPTYLALAGTSARFLHRRHDVAISHIGHALALSPPGDSVDRARALYMLHSCRAAHGGEERSDGRLSEAIMMARRLNHPRTLARYLHADVDDQDAQEEAARLIQVHGTAGEQAQALLSQAVGTWRRGDPDGAEARFAEAQRLSRDAGVVSWPSLFNEWGYFLLWRGELRRSEMLFQSSVDAVEKFDRQFTEHARWLLASVRVGLGKYTAARSGTETVIQGRRVLTPSYSTVTPRRVAAYACIGLGDWDAAEDHLRHAVSDLLQIDARFGPAHVGMVQAELLLARGDDKGALATAAEAFAQLYEEAGRPELPVAPFWETVIAVNTRSVMARTEMRHGLWDAARRGFSDVLRFRHRLGLYHGALLEIEGLAALRARSGDTKSAVRLFAATETLRLRSGIPPLPHQSRYHSGIIAPLRSDATLRTTWQDGQHLSLMEAIQLALDG